MYTLKVVAKLEIYAQPIFYNFFNVISEIHDFMNIILTWRIYKYIK